MVHFSFPPPPRRSDGVSRALAAYVLLAAAAAATIVVLVVREPGLAAEVAPVPSPMVVLQDAPPDRVPDRVPDAASTSSAEDTRSALMRRARTGDPQAELALGRLLAQDARRQHDLDVVSDAALWLERARGHGRAEAALDVAELADRYCSRHELLADRLCAGD